MGVNGEQKYYYKPSFDTTRQRVYASVQLLLGLGLISLSICEIVFSLAINRYVAYTEIFCGVLFFASGILGICSANTRRLCHTLGCLVISCFAMVVASVLVVLYPSTLLVHPELLDRKPYWYLRVGLLAASFAVGICEWCASLCQIMVSYKALRYMIHTGCDGLQELPSRHARLFEASFEPSEETMLLMGRYHGQSMDATQSSQSATSQTIQTTALISPSAPTYRHY